MVLNSASEVRRFLAWIQALGVELKDLSDSRVARYIKHCQNRGKTVPGRALNSLAWFQKVFSSKIGAEQPELKSMIRSTTADGLFTKPADAAPMIPSEIVKRLEEGVATARTGVPKIFCGLGCALTFGIKRWSDAQRVKSLSLAADSLVVRSWKSKRKKTELVRAAL